MSQISKKFLKTMLAILPAWFLVGCGHVYQEMSQVAVVQLNSEIASSSSMSVAPIANTFVDPNIFRETQVLMPWNFVDYPIAGVVNHHTLAIDLQAKFFKTLKSVRPDIRTFIILSPDHYRHGSGISTQKIPYATPAGLVSFDFDLSVGSSVWDGTDARSFEIEHGMGALAPFIAFNFPKAKIYPIFLRADAPYSRLVELGDQLARVSGTSTFMVISSDMSHGLLDAVARKHDQETLSWLTHQGWNELESATDANTDSSPAFVVLHEFFSVCASRIDGCGWSSRINSNLSFVEMAHAVSTDYGGDAKNATSYIVGFWK